MKMDKAKVDAAPGFDTDNWPNMADQAWASQIHGYYGTAAG
jgi:hypothetical protein